MEFALLHPDPDDAKWLRPVPPSSVLAQRLRPIEREIRDRRRVTIELSDAFEPFMAISAQPSVTTHAITVLEGLQTINATLDTATAQCTEEILTIQPGGVRNLDVLTQSLERVEGPVSRGVRLRTLYQHTVRHGPGVFALVSVFNQFWQLATPLTEEAPYTPPNDGITGIQRSIAKLLVEGYVDEAIARRLGMNVRTCRAHVAKLSATLGSNSRAQLGYLIAHSGILDKPPN
ncbi:hypothetical protein GCM10010207_42020 [Streptomyces atratus]|nr:hypothetical protein GCM10010207_42020 [Streptomyces atratus]